MALYYEQPRVALDSTLRALFQDYGHVADPSFLFQRWCGLQIVYSAQRLGWEVSGDIVGALFLGGFVEIVKGTVRVEWWIEPRLSKVQAARIGWESVGDVELTNKVRSRERSDAAI